VAGLNPLQLQPQPIEDCLRVLGFMLAGGQAAPAVMAAHACKREKERKGDEIKVDSPQTRLCLGIVNVVSW
jgi:hypothetical protein